MGCFWCAEATPGVRAEVPLPQTPAQRLIGRWHGKDHSGKWGAQKASDEGLCEALAVARGLLAGRTAASDDLDRWSRLDLRKEALNT